MEVVNTTSTTDPVNMYNNLNKFIMNPIIFVIIILVIVAYYVFSSSLGNNNSFSVSSSSSSSSSSKNIFEIIIIIILAILIVINAFQYFFSINLTAYIQGLFTPNTKVNVVVSSTQPTSPIVPSNAISEITTNKQVFNIPGNYYNYENAKALCKAYNADLATYDQIENAYNNGAEWCNYGWSANQLALFPTQKQTYNNLQTIPGHENDCGRAGINGGYIANPRIRFVVNCYGYKPKINNEEEEMMQTYTPYPETKQDQIFQERVDFWKNRIEEILVAPFNYNIWSSNS